MNLTPEQKAKRLRLRDDFSYYARHCLKVRPKDVNSDEGIVPLRLNKAQEYFTAKIEEQRQQTGMVRVIVLKGRQQGLSTVIGARLIWRTSQGRGLRCFVAAHEDKATQNLFEMTKRYYSNLPQVVRPHTGYYNTKGLKFDELDSSYTLATANSRGIGRSDTLQLVHISEVAFWPPSSAMANFNGLMQAVPNAPGTEVFIESTANGTTGIFAETWQEAVKGRNGFIPIFIPWFWSDEYRLPVPAGFTPTPEEQELVAEFGLDAGQLMFRRQKIATTGPELFRQEYPCYPDEAFLTTGRPVFNQDQLAELLRSSPDPIQRQTLVPGAASFEDSPRGELLIYEPRTVLDTYTIGADVASGAGIGKDNDYSVAQVLDGQKRQVAIWRGRVEPGYFALILDLLGRTYNDALIGVEANNHGLHTVMKLAKDCLYPRVYTSVIKDKVSDRETVQLGFLTSQKSKPMIVDELRTAMREQTIGVCDRDTLDEMRSFVVTQKGTLEADAGRHDDTVMALAIANHIHEGAWSPVEMPDEDYVSGI